MTVPAPTGDDGVTFDANCCITVALDLGKIEGRVVRSYYAPPLGAFLRKCIESGIAITYFPFIKDESYRNLTRAVHELGTTRGVTYHGRLNMLDRAKEKLDRLFDKLDEVPGKADSVQIEEARRFFQANEVDVTKKLNLQRPKANIPEDNDLRLLVCADNMEWEYTYIVSDDGHFVAYEDALNSSDYCVRVLPMKEIMQRCGLWRWNIRL